MCARMYDHTADPRCEHALMFPHHTPGVLKGCTCPVAGEENHDATSNPDPEER
jgi:hypothetical protein